MKLRTKLFFSVGILFFIFALTSFFLENFLVNKNLLQGERRLEQKIIKKTEKNKEKLEQFIYESISHFEAKMISLLNRLKSFPSIFTFSNPQNIWLPMAEILFTNKWIDYFSIVTDKKIATLIPGNSSLSSFSLQGSADSPHLSINKKQYRAIQMPKEIFKTLLTEVENVNLLELPTLYFFFEESKLQSLAREESTIFGDYVRTALQKEGQESLEKFIQAEFSPPIEGNYEFTTTYNKDTQRTYILLLSWALSYFSSTKFSSIDVFDSFFPEGAAIFFTDKTGGAVFSNKLFFSTDDLGVQNMANWEKSIFTHPSLKDFFLGSSYHFTNRYAMAIGQKITFFVENLSTITGEDVFGMHKGNILAAKEGKITNITPPTLPKKNFGIIDWNGKEYFFSCLHPLKEIDLYFYLLEPKAQAFAFVDYLHSQTLKIIKNISWSMRILGLVALVLALSVLHYIARKISRPISLLTKATRYVVDGHYDKVDLPTKNEKDEVGELLIHFQEMIKGLQEREKVRGVLNKVVSKEIAQEFIEGEVHLGGEEKEGVIFFADIRNFTANTEKMSPKDVITFLNSCMTKVSHIIDQHQGVIDKYVGDEVMALFGIPIDNAESTSRAIDCALEVQKELSRWNAERKQQNTFPVEVGIGIHKGKVLAGNMGAENRLNYTVLGSNVNLAARLCSAAKGGEILVTPSIASDSSVSSKFSFEKLEPLHLKGFSESIEVLRLKGSK